MSRPAGWPRSCHALPSLVTSQGHVPVRLDPAVWQAPPVGPGPHGPVWTGRMAGGLRWSGRPAGGDLPLPVHPAGWVAGGSGHVWRALSIRAVRTPAVSARILPPPGRGRQFPTIGNLIRNISKCPGLRKPSRTLAVSAAALPLRMGGSSPFPVRPVGCLGRLGQFEGLPPLFRRLAMRIRFALCGPKASRDAHCRGASATPCPCAQGRLGVPRLGRGRKRAQQCNYIIFIHPASPTGATHQVQLTP